MNSVFRGNLIFRWPERSASLVLPSLFLGSVAAHALAFYLFQVVYPPTVSIAPPPAQVTFVPPSTPENKEILRWVEAQNPTANESIQEATPPGLGELRYNPSYATVHTQPKPVEHLPEAIGFPPALDSLALTAPVPRKLVTPVVGVPSSLTFSANLAARDPHPAAPISTASAMKANLQPGEFLIGVNEAGDVRYCFLQTSSGDRNLDQESETLLEARRFSPIAPGPDDSLTWGFARFIWGGTPSSTAEPNPPASLSR
ncbi:MAG: hypothetical protein WCP06_03610 [Verrucomicrobiota bacterium]